MRSCAHTCISVRNDTQILLYPKYLFNFDLHIYTFKLKKYAIMKMILIGAVAVAIGVVLATFIQKQISKSSTTTA